MPITLINRQQCTIINEENDSTDDSEMENSEPDQIIDQIPDEIIIEEDESDEDESIEFNDPSINFEQTCAFCAYSLYHNECIFSNIQGIFPNQLLLEKAKQFVSNRIIPQVTLKDIRQKNTENKIEFKLRRWMIENYVTETAVKKLLKILEEEYEDVPKFKDIKKIDDLMVDLPIEECDVNEMYEKNLIKIFFFANLTTNFNRKPLYYINPLTLIQHILSSYNFTKEWVYSSQNEEKKTFFNHGTRWKYLECMFNQKGISFCSNTVNTPNLLLMVGIYSDEYRRGNFAKLDNCYYLTVMSMGLNMFLTKKFPLCIDPPGGNLSKKVLEHIVLNLEYVLHYGLFTCFFYPYNRNVRIYGSILTFFGDDMGYRDLYNFVTPTGSYPSRLYSRHKQQFKLLVEFNPNAVDPIQSYRETERRKNYQQVNIINIYFKSKEKISDRSRSKLLSIYGLSVTQLNQNGVSPLFYMPDNYEAIMLTSTCELHLVRLGIGKLLLHLLGELHGNSYREKINQTCPISIYKNITNQSFKINPKLVGRDISRIFDDFLPCHFQCTIYNRNESQLLKTFQDISSQLRKKKSWTNDEIISLQRSIYYFKSKMIIQFPFHTFYEPNFEGLDAIPLHIQTFGPSWLFSTEHLEKLHQENKKAYIRSTNRRHPEKNMVITFARKIKYYFFE